MIRLLTALLFIALIGMGAVWVAEHPGHVTMYWLDRRIDTSFGSENSKPIENIKNTTPNSASVCVVWFSSAKPSACGPIRIPTIR